MRLKKMYKRITAVMLSAAMLSAVAVSSAPAALAASYDKQGSAAYTYAHEIYVYPKSGIYGDVNNDKSVTLKDVVRILKNNVG